MNEVLYIRLASNIEQPIYWLIWSNSQNEIIASGQLENASQLSLLTEKAHQREVITLVPGTDVMLTALTVPGKSQRAIRLAAPYMLEDNLSQDVEQLFFAFADIKVAANGDNCFVAVVAKQQMTLWLSWLSEAGIKCRKMLPDTLALPTDDQAWSAVVIDEQIIVRQGMWQGCVIDQSLWSLAQTQWQQQEDTPVIRHYSPLPDAASDSLTFEAQPEELPLALFAQHSATNFNLLQGAFSVKSERSPAFKYWLYAASLLGCALLLNIGLKAANLYQLSSEQAQLEAQIVEQYSAAFPDSKKVRVATVRSLLKQKLAELGGDSQQIGFLPMLAQLQTAFKNVPQLKPLSIRFDGKRQEIRLQAEASNYQSFDMFKQELEKAKLTVEQGAQNNQGDMVTGSLSIRGRS